MAFPEDNEQHDVPKEFAFEYWVDATLKPIAPSPNDQDKNPVIVEEKNEAIPDSAFYAHPIVDKKVAIVTTN